MFSFRNNIKQITRLNKYISVVSSYGRPDILLFNAITLLFNLRFSNYNSNYQSQLLFFLNSTGHVMLTL